MQFLQQASGEVQSVDPDSKGMLPYGPMLAWAWAEGLLFVNNRGWPEPQFNACGKDLHRIIDDALTGLTEVVRRLPNFQLPEDLKVPTVVQRAGMDAYSHCAVQRPMPELNWELIQATAVSFLACK